MFAFPMSPPVENFTPSFVTEMITARHTSRSEPKHPSKEEHRSELSIIISGGLQFRITKLSSRQEDAQTNHEPHLQRHSKVGYFWEQHPVQ
jgi:hypothetical protein